MVGRGTYISDVLQCSGLQESSNRIGGYGVYARKESVCTKAPRWRDEGGGRVVGQRVHLQGRPKDKVPYTRMCKWYLDTLGGR